MALSKLAPDAEFIGAGDDVVILDGAGGIEAEGILMDAADEAKAMIRIGGKGDNVVERHFDLLAHPDSPQAEAVAAFGVE